MINQMFKNIKQNVTPLYAMIYNSNLRRNTLILFVSLFLLSCTKDSDLLADLVIANNEELVDEESVDEESTETSETTEETENESTTNTYKDDFVACTAGNGAEYNPTSSSDIQNAANAGKTAVITNSFDCAGCTFASGQTIVPLGGVISGTNINVNGACIIDDFSQLFTSSVTFTTPYGGSRLSIETFGGIANDNNSDDAAISALIDNTEYALGKSSSVYTKNMETIHKRTGLFDWNLGGAKIETTNASQLSHGSAVNNQNTYLFMFKGVDNIRIYNGEFDGNDLASRFMLLQYMEQYFISDLHVHNFLSPAGAYARGTAFSIKPNPTGYGFIKGEMKNTTIEHIGATSDGNANNAPYGVSKALSYNIAGNGTANIYHDNITINDIYGDDAEGFYNRNDYTSNYNYGTNDVHFFITNSTFKACQRRAIKLNASNATITGNYFETATNAPIFSGAQASYIQFFSILAGQAIQDVTFSNNEIRIVGNSLNTAFAMNDCSGVIVDNNIIAANRLYAQGTINISTTSTQNGLYSGDIGDDVEFTNNTITNLFFNIGGLYNTTGNGPSYSGNTMNFPTVGSDNPGKYWAAVSINPGAGELSGNPLIFKDMNINVAINGGNGTGLFGGVLNTQGMELKGITFNNVTINYTGSTTPVYAWAYTGKNNTSSDYGSTNSIIDCTINGASGTGAIFVKGANKSVNITNSFGDGTTAITAQ